MLTNFSLAKFSAIDSLDFHSNDKYVNNFSLKELRDGEAEEEQVFPSTQL